MSIKSPEDYIAAHQEHNHVTPLEKRWDRISNCLMGASFAGFWATMFETGNNMNQKIVDATMHASLGSMAAFGASYVTWAVYAHRQNKSEAVIIPFEKEAFSQMSAKDSFWNELNMLADDVLPSNESPTQDLE